MRKTSFIIICITAILLMGCWDQRHLSNRILVNGISFDFTEDESITASVRALFIKNQGGGQFELLDELVTAQRPTVVGLGLDMDSILGGEIDASKAHIVIIGEELAKKGIHPFIEFFYRNRESYLSSKIIISEGKAYDILAMEKEKSPIAFVILKLLEGAEADTVIPKKSTFTVWNGITDPGRDMVLPYIKPVQSKNVELDGVALFDGDKYTGTIVPKEKSGLLLSLMNRFGKTNRYALLFGPEDNRESISFAARDVKRNIIVEVDEQQKIICKINLKMDIDVMSYPQDFNRDLDIKQINNELSTELTKQAKEITDTLLAANCDALGIGRRLSSYYPELWKTINWKDEYKNIEMKPDVTVNVINTGNVF